ncbi:MAG: hypothetical protein ACN6OP_19045 [Pseudomonadales bacterium]
MTINELAQEPQIQPSAGLIEYLSAQPLYALCSDQILHTCQLIDRCCLRIQTDDINSELNTLCVKVSQLEEAISQYAMTGPPQHLADFVRQYSGCHFATDDQAHAAYINHG